MNAGEPMKRRQFLKNSVAATAAANLGLHQLFAANSDKLASAPVDAYDLVVQGGSLAGCFSALHAAQRGRRVLLIEFRTFLGCDMTATLRPWLDKDGYADLRSQLGDIFVPDVEKSEIGVAYESASAEAVFGNDIPLFNGTIKKQLVKTLLDNKVDILFMTGVWGIVADAENCHVSGLVLANKFGMQIVRCKHVIDATSSPATYKPSFSLEFYNVGDTVDKEIVVPDSVGIAQNTAYLHKGKRMPGQYFLEFRFEPATSDAEHEARLVTERLCQYLINNHAAFTKARLAHMALETFPPKGKHYVPPTPPQNYTRLQQNYKLDLSCRDVLNIYQHTKNQIEKITLNDNTNSETLYIHQESRKIPLRECRINPINDIKLTYPIQALSFDVEKYIPIAHQTEVIVAGGGTAGALATIAALEKKAKVATIEYFPELGGTCTIGRVTGYYWGYRESKLFDRIEEETKTLSETLGASRGPARMLYLRKEIIQRGGTFFPHSIICDVTMSNNAITGIVVERDGELFRITGNITIDATGDGDVAVFAGAEFEFGNKRMNCTQNYSQWDVNPGLKPWHASTTNRDHDILMNHFLSEMQRGLELSHLEAHYYDFSPMLTVRESRRIVGDYKVTLQDVVQERHYEDTICLANSDFDPHHFGDTLYTRIGCLLPHAFSAIVEIPYRAILPKGIDGLLISAKAISQSHNAMQFTRMSFDIMTLGYVTGKIAASIVRQSIRTRDFNVRTLYPELTSLEIITESTLTKSVQHQYTNDDVNGLIADVVAGSENSLFKITMLPKELAECKLLQEYHHTNSDAEKTRLAKALAWFHNPIGNEFIAAEMQRLYQQELNSGHLPWEYYRKDQDTDYWTINQDIALLGLSGDPSVLTEVLEIGKSLPLNNPPVQQERVYDRGRIDLTLVPFYNRLINICLVVERMPDKKAIPVLHRFLDDPYIGNHVAKAPEQAKAHVYGAILESRIAATLARCGDKRGFEILIAYVQDVHYLLTNYAHAELLKLAGTDYGYDRQKWTAWLDEHF